MIGRDRSIIPACDLDNLEQFEELINATKDVDGIGGYKLGFELGLRFGLPKLVDIIKGKCGSPLPVIYDHQKAATDIPDTGTKFAKTLKDSGIDIVILFPQAGPVTQLAWTKASLAEGLGVMVGGIMTHKGFIRSDGGYLADESVEEVYINAAKAGLTDFVVPGNKPDVIARIRKVIEAEGVTPTFYAPGFVAQGGSISAAAEAAGSRWHAIVGRGIYEAEDMNAAAKELCANI